MEAVQRVSELTAAQCLSKLVKLGGIADMYRAHRHRSWVMLLRVGDSYTVTLYLEARRNGKDETYPQREAKQSATVS